MRSTKAPDRPIRRRALPLSVLAVLLLGLLTGSATAQPYPPPPPDGDDPSIECDLRVTPSERIAECFGRNLDPDSEITIEVTVTDDGGAAAAPSLAVGIFLAQEVVEEEENAEPVEDDGSGYVAVTLDCEVDGIATIRGEGVGEDGQPVSDEIVRDLDDFPCPTDDDDDGDAAPGVGDRPGLAFTGTDWLLLLLVALLLILAGVGILRSRRRQPA